MAVWTLMPVNKKSIEEVMYWQKDGKTIFLRQGWRGGSVTVTTADDNKPDIDLDSDEISVYDLYDDHIVDVELDSFWDGCWQEWDWATSDLTEEEQQEIQDAWDEDSYEAVEELGWQQTDTEVFFYGELSLERINEN